MEVTEEIDAGGWPRITGCSHIWSKEDVSILRRSISGTGKKNRQNVGDIDLSGTVNMGGDDLLMELVEAARKGAAKEKQLRRREQRQERAGKRMRRRGL